MSDETTNPGDKPVNDGGGSAPQPEPEEDDATVAPDKPVNQGGGSAE